MTHPTVDAIVVNFNTRDRTIECLDSLGALGLPWLGMILVDNGSDDGSVDAIRDAHPEVTVIAAGENLGFARGVNRGVAASRADYVMLFNPDASALPGSVEALVGFARAHPEHGVYGGRTVRADGSLDPSSCWGAPSLWSLLCFATGASAAFKRSRLFDPESLGDWRRDTVREVPVVTGCLLLMRRDDWHAVGGMDERFFLYGEDAEFSVRVRRLGYRPVIVPEAVILHDVGGSSTSSGLRTAMVLAGKVTYLRRVFRPLAALTGVLLLQAGVATRAAGEAATRSGRDGWRQVWRNRRAWRRGYPSAERTLFGRAPVAAEHPRSLVVQAEPAFRTERANPYNGRLYRAIQSQGARVRDLSYWRLVTERTDVVHLHWPELSFLSGSRRMVHVARLTLFYGLLALTRMRGTVLVWTVHNLDAHEERSSPRVRRVAERLLLRNVDGIIALTDDGVSAARTAFPELRQVPAAVTPHGHYRDAYDFAVDRDAARVRLRLDATRPVVATVGQIRPYKNVPALIAAFRALDADATLLVAGKPSSPELAAEIRAAADEDPRVVLDLRFVPDTEVPVVLAAADLVVLPYRRIQNSGSAILALSADRPVLVPDLGAMRELQTDLGGEWVRMFDGELSTEALGAALTWAVEAERPTHADLTALDWDGIARRTLDAYEQFRRTARRRPRRAADDRRGAPTMRGIT
jgi:GT2 family glycosyltransferase